MGGLGEDGLQRRVCALLSLPWVSQNRSGSAYRTSGFPSWLPVVAQRLGSCGVQVDCVALLALLRRGVCDTWRQFVFSEALQSPEAEVRAAAVRSAPLLLHHLGASHHGLIGALLYGNSSPVAFSA